MAALRCADFVSPSSLLPSYTTGRRFSVKVIRCSSSIPIPPSKKLSRRKNYLRPKILRTLTPKPHETVVIGIESPENVPKSDDCVEEELQVSSSSIASNEMCKKLSPKLLAKYGFYLIGIFAFQTVCAVLFLGNTTKSPEISSDDAIDNDGRSLSGSVVSLEDIEMNEKIAEIRAMAREARKSEAKSSEKEEDEAMNNPGGGIDIEKEIEARLSTMEKRLNSQRKGLAGLRVEPFDGTRNGEKSLMFEKKYKFKAEKPPTGNVKGFGGSKGDNELMYGTVRDDDKGKKKIGENGNVNGVGNGERNPEEDQNEAGQVPANLGISGADQKSEQSRSSNEVNKSTKPGDQAGYKPNIEAGSGFGKTSFSGKQGEVRKGKPMRRAKDKQSLKDNNIWWLKLPYVLRILMRSNIDQEISEGYFTLRTGSAEGKDGQVSHIVAFEDQNDARNFSYLLESVFEDLDDFNADVVPISTKDLYDEVSSGEKNVIVVRKKQLTLYAGQPFEDVERALLTLIQEQR
ncbi:unnamed protein product [Cochlearia groenlandica]